MEDKRSDEKLNRIIAKWMGWIRDKDGNWVVAPAGSPEEPCYCTDLNEIHKAECALEQAQLNRYEDIIIYDCSHYPSGDADIVQILLLGARRRAEALVRVIESK